MIATEVHAAGFELAERRSEFPVACAASTIRSTLRAVIPPPGMTMILSSARLIELGDQGQAFEHGRLLAGGQDAIDAKPISVSSAANGSGVMSKARWNVTDSGLARSISARVRSISIARRPSAGR